MSSKRKFQRAKAGRGRAPASSSASASGAGPQKSRAELRRELAEERFAKPGSDKLWVALLGWDALRVERIWMVQTLHDAARTRDLDRAAKLAERIGMAEVEKCVELWCSSGDEYSPAEPAPKWHYLAALAARNAMGEPTAEQLQNDWEAWTSMRIAAPLRTALMTALGQGEQAAVALGAMTESENAGAVVNVLRFVWSALAYGDERAFAKIRAWSDEWLALAAEKR